MLKCFITELLWVFLFIFFIFIEKNISEYVYERVAFSECVISLVSWGMLFICGLRVSWDMGFGAWWICFMYAFIISIIIFMYNLVVYSLHLPTDFRGIGGSMWLSAIFYTLSFSSIFVGFIVGSVLKNCLFKH